MDRNIIRCRYDLIIPENDGSMDISIILIISVIILVRDDVHVLLMIGLETSSYLSSLRRIINRDDNIHRPITSIIS